MVGDAALSSFAGADQRTSEHFRSVVLFGPNSASYKFALAKSLIELGRDGTEVVPLEDLAVPFARHVCEHIAVVDRQATSSQSKFLDACRFFNAGVITEDELRDATTLLGFKNVLDAFHNLRSGPVPTRFFVDERRTEGGIRLTDDLFELAASSVSVDLLGETESRWRLVEETWDARADGEQITVLYDADRELLLPALLGKRRPLTAVRPALNGYQKGRCFYCFGPIGVQGSGPGPTSDVDHFLPHVLMSQGFPLNLDAPWNLVLSCPECNRGADGKFARVPHERFLQRLHTRNEFLISSHHPLRETLVMVCGDTSHARASFLRNAFNSAQDNSRAGIGWTPTDESLPFF